MKRSRFAHGTPWVSSDLYGQDTGEAGDDTADAVGDDPVVGDQSENQRDPRIVITSVGLAEAFVEGLLHAQLELKAVRNEAVSGDARARDAFHILLSRERQRLVFLQSASDPGNWGRLKAIFGTPPYAFLNSQDGGFLNPTGFSLVSLRSRRLSALEFNTCLCAAVPSQHGIRGPAAQHSRRARNPRSAA